MTTQWAKHKSKLYLQDSGKLVIYTAQNILTTTKGNSGAEL